MKLFSDPIRPSLGGRFFPVLYADTWGDYWGYFLVYARNMTTGEFEDGIVFQSLTTPAQVPPGFSTNRFTINTYLGALNLLALLPSALIVGGLLYGLMFMLRFLFGRARDDAERTLALLAMVSSRLSCRISLVPLALSKLGPGRRPHQGDLFTSGLSSSCPACRVLPGSFVASPPKAGFVSSLRFSA